MYNNLEGIETFRLDLDKTNYYTIHVFLVTNAPQ